MNRASLSNLNIHKEAEKNISNNMEWNSCNERVVEEKQKADA